MFGPWIGQAVELLSDHDDLYYDIEPEPFGGLAADRQSQADQRGWLDIAKFCLRGAESIGDA
jgi:hypothetical protein